MSEFCISLEKNMLDLIKHPNMERENVLLVNTIRFMLGAEYLHSDDYWAIRRSLALYEESKK